MRDQKDKTRLILQKNIANRWSPITIVAAITSHFEEPPYPTEVLIKPAEGGLTLKSVVLLNQIRSIDKKRLIKRLGTLKAETMKRVERALLLSLGVAEI